MDSQQLHPILWEQPLRDQLDVEPGFSSQPHSRPEADHSEQEASVRRELLNLLRPDRLDERDQNKTVEVERSLRIADIKPEALAEPDPVCKAHNFHLEQQVPLPDGALGEEQHEEVLGLGG